MLTFFVVSGAAISAHRRPLLSPPGHLQRQDLVLVQIHVLVPFRRTEGNGVDEFQGRREFGTLGGWLPVTTTAVGFATREAHHLVVVARAHAIVVVFVVVALFADEDDVVCVEELVLRLVKDHAMLLGVAAAWFLQQRLKQKTSPIKTRKRRSVSKDRRQNACFQVGVRRQTEVGARARASDVQYADNLVELFRDSKHRVWLILSWISLWK